VIVAATLSKNPADYEGLRELVEQVEENTGEKPVEVLGDSGFSSYANLQYLEDRGIGGYISDQRTESLRKGTRWHPEFERGRFRHNEVEDCYICPMGKRLPLSKVTQRGESPISRFSEEGTVLGVSGRGSVRGQTLGPSVWIRENSRWRRCGPD
jgi:hypothetical protein